MATNSKSPVVLQNGAPAKLPVVALVGTVAAGIVVGLIGVGGGLWFAVKTGHLPSTMLLAAPVSPQLVPRVSTHTVTLDPILANLADAGGHAYLRLGLTLLVEGAEASNAGSSQESSHGAPKHTPEAEPSVRDTVLEVVGEQTGASLLEPDGKERLKQVLQVALAARNPDIKIRSLYFTDFLVQL